MSNTLHSLPPSQTPQNHLPSSTTIQECPSQSQLPSQQDHLYFNNLSIHQQISQAKFAVYLVSNPQTEQYYAMKVYPHNHNQCNFFFLNEIRFKRFKHPNVISILDSHTNKQFSSNNQTISLSYLIMELAPYGDLFDFFMSYKSLFDELLVRTYFRQLIEGLEFLHQHGAAHLDLKLENLLLGEDFTLKIADFDLSYVEGDDKVHALGSKCYRAPEILDKTCTNPKAADVYSAGIILFMLNSQGVLPHLEDEMYQGVNLFRLLSSDEGQFWEKHCEFNEDRVGLYNKEFRELFIGMTKADPKERMSIKDVKNSKWYNGEVYSKEELIEIMGQVLEDD